MEKNNQFHFTPYDLNIGDWVMMNGDVAKLRFIDEYGDVGLDTGDSQAETPCLVSELQPIPLTREILQKNGFKNVGFKNIAEYHILADCNLVDREGGGHLVWHNGRIETFVHFSKCELFVCECKYVHQLQHALKVFGVEKDIIL